MGKFQENGGKFKKVRNDVEILGKNCVKHLEKKGEKFKDKKLNYFTKKLKYIYLKKKKHYRILSCLRRLF